MYIMDVTVSKWGNSLGIRIPKAVSLDLGLREGSTLSLESSVDGYLIRPAQPKVSYLIGDLVAQMRPENQHPEIDWGDDVGAERLEDGEW